MKYDSLKKLKLPDKPGVYFFLRGGEILYIGKATSLRDRTKSYFNQDLISTRGPGIVDMVWKADKVKWVLTDSVLEALILEASLIKKHQPKYNTKEKSDKSFNYVVITKEKLPKVIIIRGKELAFKEQQNLYARGSRPVLREGRSAINSAVPLATFGPFTNGSQLKEALKIIRRIFPFLDDKSKNYLEFYKQINLAPDLNDRKLYLQNIKNIKLFFQGKKKVILRNLQKEMKEYAKRREFENANEIKRQLFALQHINDVALLKSGNNNPKYTLRHSHSVLEGQGRSVRSEDSYEYISNSSFRIEAYDVAHMSGKNMVGVMTVVEDGEPVKSEYKKFKIRTQSDANDTGALAEILERRLAHYEWPYPKLIVVDGGKAQINTVKSVMLKSGVSIPVVSVLKDERHRPKDILGDKEIRNKYEREVLLANSEAHRFAIAYHKNMRARNFLKK